MIAGVLILFAAAFVVILLKLPEILEWLYWWHDDLSDALELYKQKDKGDDDNG